MESSRVWTRGVIMRAAVNRDDSPAAELGWLDWLQQQNVVGIDEIDTRSLVQHLRDKGSMRGGIFGAETSVDQARQIIAEEPSMAGQDLVREVSPTEMIEHGDGDGPVIAALDTGIKTSIVRNFTERGARVRLYPARTNATTLLAGDPDAIFLANGPGDPAALDDIVETLRAVIGKKPTFGICLGHQLMSRAVGLETFKLPFGHRGGNHPVKDLETGRVEITSQNHGFAVVGPGGQRHLATNEPVRWETNFGTAQLSHLNLYDRTVEGLTLLDVPGGTVQYHPEAGPGPNDALYLFDRFLEQINAAS